MLRREMASVLENWIRMRKSGGVDSDHQEYIYIPLHCAVGVIHRRQFWVVVVPRLPRFWDVEDCEVSVNIIIFHNV